jgi:diadenosine tetraphosphate (Ap4A) HIT family hydrolase
VFIKNLSYEATYEEVARFFSAAGQVVNIRRTATEQGRPQGWAHVQFDEEGAVAEACRLHGSKLLGRELFIDAANAGRGQQQQQRESGGGGAPTGEAVQGCWFCLSSPDVDTNLVVSVAEECYVALDKGQINPNHVQLVPIEHYPSLVAAPAGCFQELTRYLSALRACFAAQGGALVGFERHLRLRHQGGNHCHLQVRREEGGAMEGACVCVCG